MRKQLEEEGAVFDTALDTEVMARLIEHARFGSILIAIVCGVLLVAFIVFAFKQGMKVSSDRENNGTNSDNMFSGGGNDHGGGLS